MLLKGLIHCFPKWASKGLKSIVLFSKKAFWWSIDSTACFLLMFPYLFLFDTQMSTFNRLYLSKLHQTNSILIVSSASQMSTLLWLQNERSCFLVKQRAWSKCIVRDTPWMFTYFWRKLYTVPQAFSCFFKYFRRRIFRTEFNTCHKI